jgi:hypothetical protein
LVSPAVSTGQVVADRAAVDDDDGPGVVGVGRVPVVDKAGVEHLGDAGHVRCPRLDTFSGRSRCHITNVQDITTVWVLARDVYTEPKIAVVVRDDLATWQKLNVTAFVVSGIASGGPELIGLPYEDGSGVTYMPMFAIPIVVLLADQAGLRRAFERAGTRGLGLGVYTQDLFSTGNDVDNRAAVARVATAELDLVGIAVVGERRDVDKALDKLRLHP